MNKFLTNQGSPFSASHGLYLAITLFLLLSCSAGDNASPGADPPGGDPPAPIPAIIFTTADNPGLSADVNIDFGSNPTNVFYIPRTRTQLPSLSLKGTVGSGYSITPDITVARDYSNTQVLAVTEGGVTRTIYLSGFRQPTAVASSIMPVDVVSLDYEITSDILTNGVFALYRSDVTGITADDVLLSATRFIRNLTGKSNDNTAIVGREYLYTPYASTSVRGSSSDVVPLTPNTEYKLYFAYEFVNGKQVVELITSTTQDATTTVLGTSDIPNFPPNRSTISIPMGVTETMVLPVILYNYHPLSTLQWRGPPSLTLLINRAIAQPGVVGYTETVVPLNSNYTLVYLKKTDSPLFQGASTGQIFDFGIQFKLVSRSMGYTKDE